MKSEGRYMRKVTTQLIDDFDETVIEEGQGGTVFFAFGQQRYELDLSNSNQHLLREALEPFIRVARPQGSNASKPTLRAKSDPTELQAIREWAAANGHEVSGRGRIPAAVREAYAIAH